MTKANLVENVVAKTGLKKKDAEAAVAAVIGSVKDALVAGDKVQLIGFGTFAVKERAARAGRNPATKQALTIPASKNVRFVAGAALKDAVNK